MYSKTALQLPPVPQSVGVFPQYIARQTETLVLREKVLSFSGNDFSIQTLDGRPIFRAKGEALSLSRRTHVMDTQGNPLFTTRREIWSIPQTYYAEDPNGQKFFEVVGKWSLFTSKSVGKFTSSCGKEESLHMKGDVLDTCADIVDQSTGLTVARIDRDFFNKSQLLGAQTFVVTIAPGVDMALILAMCICLEERRRS